MSRSLFVFFLIFASVLVAGDDHYTDVPFVPTPNNVVDAMLDLAGIRAGDVLVDLGSGDGRIVIAASKRFGIRATGVEINPDLVRQSETLARQEGVSERTRFVQADLFEYDFRPATVVMMYLTPAFNLRLRSKLLSELRPGTRVVSHRFDMGSWVPAKTVQVGDDHAYLWIVPERRPDLASVEKPAGAVVPFEKLVAMFTYDATAPLNVHLDPPVSLEGAQYIAASYAGARGPVSATLVTPSRKGRYPAVVFAHDFGKRDEFIPEALALARGKQPFVSLLIDAPPERPVGWRRSFNSLSDNDNDREIHIQAVIDIRRAIDWLASREDVDGKRIGYVGHGYGANWGAILASIEPRVREFVLVAGFPSLAELLESDDPEMANMRFALGGERFSRYKESIAGVDPMRFTGFWAGAPILFQFGRFDQFVSRAMAERLAHSISRPQKSVFYDAGHSMNDPQAVADRAKFLSHL